MGTGWAHMGTSIVASFLASLVECVEALTVVLAVGSVRGWRSALTGTATAIAVLLIIIAAIGTALAHIPLPTIQLVVGTLLLLFGLRWLRKAILRSAGQIPLHDEQAAFQKNTEAMHCLRLRNLLGRRRPAPRMARSRLVDPSSHRRLSHPRARHRARMPQPCASRF